MDSFSFADSDLKLSDMSRTVTGCSDLRKWAKWQSAYGNLLIAGNGNQVCKWNMSCNAYAIYAHGASILVGITSTRNNSGPFHRNKADINYAYYPSYREKYCKYKGVQYGNKFSIPLNLSFSLSVELNCKTKEIVFYYNNQSQGAAYVIPNDNTKYCLAISIQDHIKVSISSVTLSGDDINVDQKQNDTSKSNIQSLKLQLMQSKQVISNQTKQIEKINKDNLLLQNLLMQSVQNVSKLENQISKLLDEQKEMKLKINSLEKENHLLKRKSIAIDVTKFEQWDCDSVLIWIFSIENGLFKRIYGDVLIKEVKNAELTGIDLMELNTNDMKGFGINIFKHRKLLEKHIKLLTKNYNKNQDLNMNQDQVEGVYNTDLLQ